MRKPALERRIGYLVFFLLLTLSATASQPASPNNPSRFIEDPGGQAMVSFYGSLSRSYLGEWVTRIVHYGDSHVAADILTGALRRELQLWFDDAGAGFVLPGGPFFRACVDTKSSAGWHLDGLTQASLASDARLGLAGVSLSANKSGEWISVTATGSYFDIYLLKQPGGGAIDVLLDGVVRKPNFSLASHISEPAYIEIVADAGSLHTIEIRTISAGLTRIFRNCNRAQQSRSCLRRAWSQRRTSEPAAPLELESGSEQSEAP